MNDQTKPNFEYVDITPELAEEWLTRNHCNRTIRDYMVDAYARDMAKGEWALTGDTIKIDPDNNLLDGQHRLTAIVRSGTPVTLSIAFNVPPASQGRVDAGMRRKAADNLVMQGISQAIHVAASARVAVLMDRYGSAAPTHRFITNSEIEDFALNTPNFIDIVVHAKATYKNIQCPPAVLGYTTWVLTNVDNGGAAEFFHGLDSLIGMVDGDPRLTLSRRLMHLEKRTRTDEYIAYIFKAWAPFRLGQTLAYLRLGYDRAGRVKIPVPFGLDNYGDVYKPKEER